MRRAILARSAAFAGLTQRDVTLHEYAHPVALEGEVRLLLALAVVLAACGPAAAEKVQAGKRGGFWCADINDFEKTLKGEYKNALAAVGPSCKIIDANATVEADSTDKGGRLLYGLGRFDGKTAVPFVLYQDDVAAPPPAPATPARAPASPPEGAEKRTYKRVSPRDLRNAPDKWQGRDIEFANVQVYWTDDDDVRITANTNVMLLARSVSSTDARFLRSECKTELEASMRKCRVTARFRLDRYGEDKPVGILKRTVLVARDVELIRAGKKR